MRSQKTSTEKQRHYYELLVAMTKKEILTKYKFAFFGLLWIIINPILQMLTIGLIFQHIIPVKVENYFIFLLVGLLPWNLFALSVTKSVSAIVNQRQLIQKSNFPRELIILSIVLSNVFHFFVALVLLIILLVTQNLIFNHTIHNTFEYLIRLLLLAPISLLLISVCTGFSLLFATLNVKFRDVNFIVNAILPLWFYATPIFYTLNLLPNKFAILYTINPLAGITQLYQMVLLNQPLMSPTFLSINILLCILIFAFGWWIFKKQSPYFDDWV